MKPPLSFSPSMQQSERSPFRGSQRQENDALKLRLRRMKEATIATLKRYNANLSPGALTLSNFLGSPGLKDDSEVRRSAEYDVDMSDFVIKTSNLAAVPPTDGGPGVSPEDQKENLPAAQDAKKGKAKRLLLRSGEGA